MSVHHHHSGSHGDAHSHGGHGDSKDARGRVAIAAWLTFGFMAVEIAGGLISGSLALLADAAHMLTDAGSLALAWLGFRLSERPADARHSYGFHRVKVLAAFVNALALLVLAVWIVWEAIERLRDPSPVLGSVMLFIAIGGLLVNLVAFAVLHGGNREDLNLRGALWHVIGDLLGSVAAIIAAVVIVLTGWAPVDPLLSVLVALLVAFAGLRLARESGHILLEGTPPGLSATRLSDSVMRGVAGVTGVSHVHAWSLNEARPLVTMEVQTHQGASAEQVRREVKALLLQEFDVSHATVEVIGVPEAEPEISQSTTT